MANKEINWKRSSRRPAILLIPGSLIYYHQSRVLSHNTDRHCAYNVTLWRVGATTVVVEKQWASHRLTVCMCSVRYPARNVHAPHHLWPDPLNNALPHYLINDRIFENKNFSNLKRVFRVSLQLLSETFFVVTRTERDMIENVCWSSCKVSVTLVRF
jgi:hypothetical protein